ncbi:hypothetical protein ND747_16590, partial [Frankia sp. R82]
GPSGRRTGRPLVGHPLVGRAVIGGTLLGRAAGVRQGGPTGPDRSPWRLGGLGRCAPWHTKAIHRPGIATGARRAMAGTRAMAGPVAVATGSTSGTVTVEATAGDGVSRGLDRRGARLGELARRDVAGSGRGQPGAAGDLDRSGDRRRGA